MGEYKWSIMQSIRGEISSNLILTWSRWRWRRQDLSGLDAGEISRSRCVASWVRVRCLNNSAHEASGYLAEKIATNSKNRNKNICWCFHWHKHTTHKTCLSWLHNRPCNHTTGHNMIGYVLSFGLSNFSMLSELYLHCYCCKGPKHASCLDL